MKSEFHIPNYGELPHVRYYLVKRNGFPPNLIFCFTLLTIFVPLPGIFTILASCIIGGENPYLTIGLIQLIASFFAIPWPFMYVWSIYNACQGYPY